MPGSPARPGLEAASSCQGGRGEPWLNAEPVEPSAGVGGERSDHERRCGPRALAHLFSFTFEGTTERTGQGSFLY